jgi:hypothetical protein
MAMSSDDTAPDADSKHPNHNAISRKDAIPAAKTSYFSIPAPLKRIFDNFPLITYPENESPLRAPKYRDQHVLHIFATQDDARNGRPSFNPACLKWQTYLKFLDVNFKVVSSTNHASPSGILPFLLPATKASESATPSPVPSNKLKRWLSAQKIIKDMEEHSDIRSDAYMSLLENLIRKAWVGQSLHGMMDLTNRWDSYTSSILTQRMPQLCLRYMLSRALPIYSFNGRSHISFELQPSMSLRKLRLRTQLSKRT